MSNITPIFKEIEDLIESGNGDKCMLNILIDTFKSKELIKNEEELSRKYNTLKSFLENIINEIDKLANEIRNHEVLISVKNQKTLRTCYQILTSFGISPCLIPGLGISLSKRCVSAQLLPQIVLSDEQKYEILTICTDFLYRSYDVPVLKSIIITLHLSDYLAALIQLAFAPLKKPGVYSKFIMTEELYEKLNYDRQKYVNIYEYLVNNCFQPMLMKELLVLQSITDPLPPPFAKRVIAKEMSRRLTMPGGLLSLIRCFIETIDLDTGVEWKKIDMICKIVCIKHGNMTEKDYLKNITSQLKQILLLNNAHYLATATSCLLNLLEKFGGNECVIDLAKEVLKSLDYETLLIKCEYPGTIILTPQEVDHYINIFHACTSLLNTDIPPDYISSNLYVLFLLKIKCTKDETKSKLSHIILKGLEVLSHIQLKNIIEKFLFGWEHTKPLDLVIEEYDAGLAIKCSGSHIDHQLDAAAEHFLDIFEITANNVLVENLFECCLQIFININDKKQKAKKANVLQMTQHVKDECELLTANDEKYAQMLQILAVISSSQKVLTALKANPWIVLNFLENLFSSNNDNSNDECKTIALVLLNTILANIPKTNELEQRLHKLLPILKQMSEDSSEYVSILCKETVSLILSEFPTKQQSAYEKAHSDVFDNLLPVRAHGIMELTKLIDKSDLETLSKRHYIFCLLQEQLKDSDSYIYLSAVNGLASLATHCTNEVLSALCKEYLEISLETSIDTQENHKKVAELRMKLGDIIVKVTRRLGEIAVVHKTILLNTMLCASRDNDPLIRASALSNLAEIALVINYKIGTIIYEVLLCIWNIIETDKAIECRRAAVMVIASLLKGLGQDTLVELKENILPIYRTLNKLYKDPNEDSILKLHAQIALEELDDIVKKVLCPELPMEKEILMINNTKDIIFK
ncbi:unnamed protein product, partial [Brenthis ino]